MLIEMLIAWAIVVPAIVVCGLYAAAGYLSRHERPMGMADVSWLDEMTAIWERSSTPSGRAEVPRIGVPARSIAGH